MKNETGAAKRVGDKRAERMIEQANEKQKDE
jgi:hypothetical protein